MSPESEERWRGKIDATLEGIQNELIPLRSIPQSMAIMQVTAEREAEERAKRNEDQDKRLARIERKLDKAGSRRTLLLGLVPVFVALITTAGFLLHG